MHNGEWDCSKLPTEAPKDEKVVRFVGQAAGVVVRQTCSKLQMSQQFDFALYLMMGVCFKF